MEPGLYTLNGSENDVIIGPLDTLDMINKPR